MNKNTNTTYIEPELRKIQGKYALHACKNASYEMLIGEFTGQEFTFKYMLNYIQMPSLFINLI